MSLSTKELNEYYLIQQNLRERANATTFNFFNSLTTSNWKKQLENAKNTLFSCSKFRPYLLIQLINFGLISVFKEDKKDNSVKQQYKLCVLKENIYSNYLNIGTPINILHLPEHVFNNLEIFPCPIEYLFEPSNADQTNTILLELLDVYLEAVFSKQ